MNRNDHVAMSFSGANTPKTQNSVRVSYVDLAPRPGGSIVSLQTLARGLGQHETTRAWQLSVILNAQNPAAARLAASGIFSGGALAIGSRQGLGDAYPTLVENARESEAFSQLRKVRGFTKAWQGAGMLVRLAREILPQALLLRRALARQKPDIVHLNDIVPVSRAGILAARLLGRPVVCHVRALDALTWLDRWLTRGVDAFIFISKAVAEQQRSAGATIRFGAVVPNAVNLDDFSPELRNGNVRQELGILHDAFVIGSVGRLVTWKGHHVALQAFADFMRVCPKAHLLIAGATDVAEPGYEHALRQQAAALGIESRVTFAGHREDAPAVLAALDVLCHCAIEPEPFGRVVIEGMAAQRPVIASAAGGVLEIIQPNVNGLLVPPNNKNALVDALTDLWKYPTKAHALALAGRQRVETTYTSTQHVANVVRVYEHVREKARR